MPAGLVPLDFGGEVNDHGEESYYRAKMLSRALRRLARWEDGKGHSSSSTRRPRRVKGERVKTGGVRPVLADDSADEEDEEMLDVEDADAEALERRGDESSSGADEDDDDDAVEREGEGGHWEPVPHTLPPLGRLG